MNSKSGNILDGGDTGGDDLTAASGTIVVSSGGTFGTTTNGIERTSAGLNTSGVTTSLEDETASSTLTGTSETVGDASVDQTINIVEDLAKTVEKNNQVPVGGSSSTVSLGIDPSPYGSGPILVDVFAEKYELVNTEAFGPEFLPAVGQLNDFWFSEGDEN